VPRYNTVQLRFATGALAQAQFVDAKALDAAEAELAGLREEVARKDVVIEDMVESNSDMTTCLAAAEQQNAELVELLGICKRELFMHKNPALHARLDAIIAPAASAASNGFCKDWLNCECGGDTPGVRATCDNRVKTGTTGKERDV
jgi:hypothetical protein